MTLKEFRKLLPEIVHILTEFHDGNDRCNLIVDFFPPKLLQPLVVIL